MRTILSKNNCPKQIGHFSFQQIDNFVPILDISILDELLIFTESSLLLSLRLCAFFESIVIIIWKKSIPSMHCSCTPDGIISSLPGLMVAIRNVSKTAHYFNTPSNVTGLFVKISNQLTITSKNYLTDNGRVDLWSMSPNDVISKIEKCRLILESYKNQYFETCHDMAEAGEKPWVISSVYIFTCLDKFMGRLNQVGIIGFS